ncbi:hypothetical protein ACNKHR_04965 [Shigella flexneri]
MSTQMARLLSPRRAKSARSEIHLLLEPGSRTGETCGRYEDEAKFSEWVELLLDPRRWQNAARWKIEPVYSSDEPAAGSECHAG